jgi:predicted acyl esterase
MLSNWILPTPARVLMMGLAVGLGCGSVVAADPPEPRTVSVIMRDGAALGTDIHLPADPGPHPVILARTPYNKALGVGFGRDGARRGYAVVVQDTRGRFGSDGENLPFHRDVADGADTVHWIRKQPWSNGRIGTWGGSAGAITQFQLEASETSGVMAQHLVVGAPDLYEVVHTGGVFRKSLVEDWIRASQFQEDAVARWVAHPVKDGYWRQRDASLHYPAVRAAAVHIGGYWDIFAQSTIDGFNGYQTRGGEGARGRQKLVMGPWTHGVMQEKADARGSSAPVLRV